MAISHILGMLETANICIWLNQNHHLIKIHIALRYKKHFPSRKDLDAEIDRAMDLNAELEKDFPVLFTHADPHNANLIYNPHKGR